MSDPTSYTCLDFRREKLADPRRLSPAAHSHLQDCPVCRAFARRIDAGEAQVEQVLAVTVPEGLSDRVLLRVHQHRLRPWRAMALAATVLLSFGIGFLQWQPRATPDYARFAIEHVLHEPQALAGHRLADPSQFRFVLANFGGRMHRSVGKVRYMKLCPVPGGTGWHIVLDTEYGPATLLLIPGKDVSRPTGTVEMKGYAARALPGGQGYYAIITESPQALDAVSHMLAERISWQT
ncbi:DUF3379 family protein [Denitromonas iodatirespirans]|uniref:DUF3379 family protein n=1 Tax=Denitromonas iodatirespirans TaxID=2795389 RepID=A0A944DB31_DENI1|nr:DUF3379 family protein [Denitromonas iodatirespirans]MBT0962067.1 DUF3379 family protein [Denitromonas iodatirespirans]